MTHTATRLVAALARERRAPLVGAGRLRLLYHRPPEFAAGAGRILATVRKQGTPHVPVARRVRLMYHDPVAPGDALPILETWSHPDTGVYEFAGIALGRAYAVAAFDHTGEYNGVIAAPVYAEPMP